MKFKLLAAVTAAVLAVLTFASPAQADHSWGNYHWARTANPFELKIGDNVTSNWDSYLRTASSDWSKSSVMDTTIVAGQASGRNCKGTTGRIEVCNGAYGFNGWLGIASISVTGGSHITSGTTRVNDSYFNTATYNTPAWRQMVMCQEIGHDFGLDHQDENFDNPNLGTCMDYTSDPGTNQHPNQHDYQQLEDMYRHLDSTSTISSGQSLPNTSAITDSPSSWGTLVHGNTHRGYGLYVRDLGGGNLILTRVLWA